MIKSFVAVAIAVAAFMVAPAMAANMYISDELTVPLRSGPTTGHKILHAGLSSGTVLEILAEDKASGFSQVRTPNGLEGWVQTQYLVREPVARDRLVSASRRVQTLEAELAKLREESKLARGARTESEKQNSALDNKSKQLETELNELRRISGNAIAQHEENKQLKATSQEMQTQVTQLTEQVRQLERNSQFRWLMGGGALVLIGLVFGVWLRARPKKRTGW